MYKGVTRAVLKSQGNSPVDIQSLNNSVNTHRRLKVLFLRILIDISATPGPLVEETLENAFCTVETLIFLKSKEEILFLFRNVLK